MSINICFSVLLIVSGIFTYVNSQDAIRQYVIRKDFFNGIKAAEFSIYDKNENIQYRIESSYSVMQSVKLIAYPSKQEVGRLKAQINFLTYKAEISILDSQTNQWINGLVEQDFQFIGTSCNINWNGNRITMENDIASFTSKFRNTNGQLLAQFRLRPASILVTNKYDMEIFSNQYPDQLYLLALAAREQIRSAKKNG
jgi:uncharacterized protein YxjI